MSHTVRLANVDALRGLASLAVCWFHMTNGYSENSLVRASGQYGWLGIEIFFVISGFIIPYALCKGGYTLQSGWGTFIWKRILRIEPPYLIAMLLTLGLWYASSIAPGFRGQPPPGILSTQVLFHVGYLNGIVGYPWLNPVFWTLAIEFQFYLLISILFGLIGSRRWGTLILANGLLLLAPFVIRSELFVFHYLGLFLLGVAAFQYQVGLIGRTALSGCLAAAALSVFVTHGLLASLAGLATVLLLLQNVPLLANRSLVMLRAISYSLYLLHVPIGGRVVNLGRRYVETQSGEALLSIGAVIVSVFSAYVFYRLVEKPSQEIASKFKYRLNKTSFEPNLRLRG